VGGEGLESSAPPLSSAVLIAVFVVAAALAAWGGYVLWRRRQARIEAERLRAEAERRRRAAASGSGDLLTTAGVAARAFVDTAQRFRDQSFGEALRGSIEQLAGWAETERPDMRKLAASDGTATILFSDIEDSTALNEALGDKAWVRVLGAHDRVVRERVAAHDGNIVKSQGDGFMVTFASVEEAVRCAVEIERGFENGGRRLRKTPIRVRIGIHVGQVVAKDGDLFGRNVAYAARVAAEADGGEILVSEDVRDRLGGDGGVSLSEPRSVELKGLEGEHAVFAVDWRESG
jgi:adenylate cyclase